MQADLEWPELKEKLLTPVSVFLNLPGASGRRAYNALLNEGFSIIGALYFAGDEQLARTPNLGGKTIADIKAYLKANDFPTMPTYQSSMAYHKLFQDIASAKNARAQAWLVSQGYSHPMTVTLQKRYEQSAAYSAACEQEKMALSALLDTHMHTIMHMIYSPKDAALRLKEPAFRTEWLINLVPAQARAQLTDDFMKASIALPKVQAELNELLDQHKVALVLAQTYRTLAAQALSIEGATPARDEPNKAQHHIHALSSAWLKAQMPHELVSGLSAELRDQILLNENVRYAAEGFLINLATQDRIAAIVQRALKR